MNIELAINNAKKGNAQAQKYLFEVLADRMMLVCLRYLKKKEDAEEIVLDGFYKVFNSLDGFQYKGEAALIGWVKKIMINECLMFLRKKNVLIIIAESEIEDIAFPENALEKLSSAEILQTLYQLPIGYRTVFNLYVIEGIDHKEIAKLMGITEGTSRSQLSKAKSMLQKILTVQGIEYAKQKAK